RINTAYPLQIQASILLADGSKSDCPEHLWRHRDWQIVTGLTVTHIQERNPRHEQHWKSGEPLALPHQEHARGGVGRSVCGILRHLWRPHLRLQEFGQSQGIPLSNSPGAAKTSEIPPALSLSR